MSVCYLPMCEEKKIFLKFIAQASVLPCIDNLKHLTMNQVSPQSSCGGMAQCTFAQYIYRYIYRPKITEYNFII